MGSGRHVLCGTPQFALFRSFVWVLCEISVLCETDRREFGKVLWHFNVLEGQN